MAPVKSKTDTSEKDFYQTPDYVFSLLSRLYGPFDVDLYANAKNHKCPLWCGPDSPIEIFDTFEQHINTSRLLLPLKAFGNPPYSKGYVPTAVALAYQYAIEECFSTTLLIPARTDQSWWTEYVWSNENNAPRYGVEVYFFPYRIKFIRPNGQIAASPTDASVAITFRIP